MKILVTGVAGFIGMHVSLKLIEQGHYIIGVDNLNEYYDVKLKLSRLENLKIYKSKFRFFNIDIEDKLALKNLFKKEHIIYVLHLAAQVGVRNSINNPEIYLKSNILGFLNILENCNHFQIQHLVYASSSSVYGLNSLLPFQEDHSTDHPVSLYGATKKSNELMAHVFSNLYSLPTTGLRFFSVYGPWGRPDMALFHFANLIYQDKPIEIFNNGSLYRGFTYIDDIVKGVVSLLFKKASASSEFDQNNPKSSISLSPFRIFNIGNQNSVPLMQYISRLEIEIGRKVQKVFLPMQKGDVNATSADNSALNNWVSFYPNTSIEHGIRKFVEWYKEYYNKK